MSKTLHLSKKGSSSPKKGLATPKFEVSPEHNIPSSKVSVEEFLKRAFKYYPREGYKGFHTVYTGFNEAFREYYKDEKLDPVVETKKLAAVGKLRIYPARGGATLYPPK